MKNRSVIKVIILSVLTVGIYLLFWLGDTRKELVEHGQDVPPVIILLAPVLALIGVTVLQYVLRAGTTASKGLDIISVLVAVLVVCTFIPLSIWWFYKYCRAVEAVTYRQTSVTMSLGLLIILALFGVAFIWPGIIQDGFNRIPAPPAPGIPPTIHPAA